MIRTVYAGQHARLHGTLAAGTTLVGEGGVQTNGVLVAGAAIDVLPDAAASNFGLIALYGAYDPAASGATLRDYGVLTNVGTLSVGGGHYGDNAALLAVRGTLVDQGLITVAAGDGGSGGKMSIAAGGMMTVAGGQVVLASGDAAATLTDAGVMVNDGSVIIGGETGRTAEYGAVLNVTGTLINNGAVRSDGYVIGGADSGSLDVSGVLDNLGTMNLVGHLDDSGVITNIGVIFGFGSLDVTGTLDNLGIISNLYPVNDFGMIDNRGTLIFYDGGYRRNHSSVIATSLVNTGTVLVDAGSTVGVRGDLTNTGLLKLYSGVSGIGFEGVDKSYGALFNITGSLDNAGTVDIAGSSYGGESARLSDFGTITSTGSILVGGSTGGSVGYYGFYSSGAAGQMTVAGVLVNDGSITLGAGISYEFTQIGVFGNGGRLIDSGVLDNNGVLTIDAGTGQREGMLTLSGLIQGSGTIVNDGLIQSAENSVADGVISVASFVNDGQVVVHSDEALTVDGEVATSANERGVFKLDGPSTLTLDGAIGSGERVAFVATPATLVLGDPMAFAGTLDGLAAGITLDFSTQDVVSATSSGDELILGLASGGTFDLALDAPLTGVTFSLGPDGQGGTDVVLLPAGETPAGPSYGGGASQMHAAPAPAHTLHGGA